jgi:molybdopterin converting factor small subunit
MIEISIRYLGGLRIERGRGERIFLPEGSTIRHLRQALLGLDINLADAEVAVVLDGHGLDQYPDEHRLSTHPHISVFPVISGGHGFLEPE